MDGTGFEISRPKRIKEMTMFSMKSTLKTILAAASLAVLSAAGIGAASAQPWDHSGYHNSWHDRGWRHDRFERHAFVNRMRVADTLRFHHYRMIGDPYFVHGRYVVRTHDRFGRIVFVQVDPYSGAFVREVRL
jgi:Ni/Co efflux regulator RcnB